MTEDYIALKGRQYRVEVNWRTMTNAVEALGRDIDGIAELSRLKPSDIAVLMVEAIREGERLDGRESDIVREDIDSLRNFGPVKDFLEIYIRQLSPDIEPDDAKKKEA